MKKLLPLLTATMLLCSCDDIFEKDISGRLVEIIAPSDKARVGQGEVTFRWETMEGAEKYRFTLVSPSFAAAAVAVKDTLMFSDSVTVSMGFRLVLPEGEYQWRVQALNVNYVSLSSVYGLGVLKTEAPGEEESEQSDEKDRG